VKISASSIRLSGRASASKNSLTEYITDDCIYAERLNGKWYIDRESIDNYMLQDPVKVHLSRLRFVR